MNVLVIGKGGREHCIAWKLSQSPKVNSVYCAPGNPGMAAIGENVNIAEDDLDALAKFAKEKQVDLTVVGPEYPLSCGIVDYFTEQGLTVFGPTKAAAELESSKSFAKEIMQAAGVPTASYELFTDKAACKEYLQSIDGPIVLKADGLAAGKGVFVCKDQQAALEACDELYQKYDSGKVVVEGFLEGVEASFIVAVGSDHIVPLATAHDFKRIGEADTGPNTGGMGCVSPTPRLTPEQEIWAVENVIQPVVQELKNRSLDFKGFLYAGLMITESGEISVLEFNVRLGDPETQVILPRMQSDLFELLYGLSKSDTKVAKPEWKDERAICVVLASEGYPASSSSGDLIDGVELANQLNAVTVFHAGTKVNEEQKLVTGGGRVLGVSALGDTAETARSLVYRAVDMIQFRGRQIRRDIC